MLLHGEYNSTPPVLLVGKPHPVQLDQSANLKVTLATKISGEDLTNDLMKTEVRGTYKYQATAAANVVVKASAGFLYGIIIGKDVTNGIIEVSDHASDGDGNVQIYLEGSTLMTSTGGYIPVNASFAAGITADLTLQTNVTFIYR